MTEEGCAFAHSMHFGPRIVGRLRNAAAGVPVALFTLSPYPFLLRSSFHPLFIPFLPVHRCNLWTASGRQRDREDRDVQPDKSLVVKRADRGGGDESFA